ncbi:HAMP domain-containing histidine kinase [Serpentinicella alkaliphila]|nr:HAMP domain-containing histidine kinase [Serpentinicella alkaliphila]
MPYTLITIVLLFIYSFISVSIYLPLKEAYLPHEENIEKYFNNSSFVHTLGRHTKYLYQSKILKEDWYESRFEKVDSIKFYVPSTGTNQELSNIKNIDNTILQREIDNSLYYVTIKVLDNGIIETEGSLDINQSAFLGGLVFSNQEDLNKFTGLEITYIVPRNFASYSDIFTNGFKELNIESYLILILVIGGISILLLLIIAFSIPYIHQQKSIICRLYNKLFLEFKILLWAALFAGFGALVFGLINVNHYYYGLLNIVEMVYDVNRYFYLLGISITFLIYMFVYLNVVYIKNIYHLGFKEGFVRNSIIGRLSGRIIRFVCNKVSNIKKSVRRLLELDISKDPNKKIIIILITNIVVLWFVALGGWFMILVAIAYSIFLFKYFVSFMYSLKDIHDASCQLAVGDFNISLEEEMGLLSPIAKNLNNIKEGFQLAINKEIKSERMKAELISNVSHDLKTPLTSIITYVDLLQKPNLSVETQAEYVQVLEKKSKRLKLLIEDLFEASKASSGNIDLYLEKIDVISLFRQTLGELEERIKESTLIFKTNLPDNKVMCLLDGKRTYRIFENIMNNIFKYSMEYSRVYIDVQESIHEVAITFKNISSYEMNFDNIEITERFARGDKSRTTEGSGLGLSIAKNLVQLQKGELNIAIDGDLFKLTIKFPKSI